LAQLASRISAAIRRSSRSGANADPFAKVKGLITEMISKLEADGEADATHKAYCDKETSEITTKKGEKTAELEKLNTGIDEMSSRIAVLEEEVSTLMGELATIAQSQAGYDKWFAEIKETIASNKADMEAGIEGVKLALKVLREYYAKDGKSHNAAEGSGSGIIGLLEVAEADFTKTLAEMTESFTNQKAAWEQTTKENELTITAKKQDVKYKTEEITTLKKSLSETNGDATGVKAELDAVLEQLKNINKMCVAKAEPYEEKKQRREAEIAGLKEGLAIIEGDGVFLQKNSQRSL
jgi:chromosome segregation ATPase